MKYDYDVVFRAVGRLVYFFDDVSAITDSFMSYYDDDVYLNSGSLVRNICRYLKAYDSAQISCSIPYDVLSILLFDPTLLPLGKDITHQMSSDREHLLMMENECLMLFRNKYMNVGVENENLHAPYEVSDALHKAFNIPIISISKDEERMVELLRHGISKNLTLQEKQLREEIYLRYIITPLLPFWQSYSNIEFPEELVDMSFLHNVVPNPSFMNYIEKTINHLTMNQSIEGEKFISYDEFAEEYHADNVRAIYRAASPPYSYCEKDEKDDEKHDSPIVTKSQNVMKDISCYLEDSISKSSLKLNTLDYKKPCVIATLLRRLIQGGEHGQFSDGVFDREGRQIDWAYVLTSVRDDCKIGDTTLRRYSRLEEDGTLVLLDGGHSFDLLFSNNDIIAHILNVFLKERTRTDESDIVTPKAPKNNVVSSHLEKIFDQQLIEILKEICSEDFFAMNENECFNRLCIILRISPESLDELLYGTDDDDVYKLVSTRDKLIRIQDVFKDLLVSKDEELKPDEIYEKVLDILKMKIKIKAIIIAGLYNLIQTEVKELANYGGQLAEKIGETYNKI